MYRSKREDRNIESVTKEMSCIMKSTGLRKSKMGGAGNKKFQTLI